MPIDIAQRGAGTPDLFAEQLLQSVLGATAPFTGRLSAPIRHNMNHIPNIDLLLFRMSKQDAQHNERN